MLDKYKLLFLILTIFSISFYAQTLDFEYVQTIDQVADYKSSTILTQENRLLIDAKGAIEEYYINSDGSLTLNSRLKTFYYSLAEAQIYSDMLYVAEDEYGDNASKISIIDISGDEMVKVDSILVTGPYVINMQVNEDYILYSKNGSTLATLVDRTTLETITTLEVGAQYTLIGNYLIFNMLNASTDEGALCVWDISNPLEPVEVDFTIIGNLQFIYHYYVHNDLLYVCRSDDIVIMDISNLTNIEIVRRIDNIPQYDYYYIPSCKVYENMLIFNDGNNFFWFYDVSEPANPQFIARKTELMINGTTQKNNFTPYSSYLYTVSHWGNIAQLDATMLPQIEVIEEHGSGGMFNLFNTYSEPFLIYNNFPQYRYFSSNEDNPQVHKMQPAFYGVGYVASNEDYICYMTNPEIGLNYLRLYSCNEEDIILENEIQMSSYCYYVYLENNYLFMRNSSDDLEVYEILPDYTIEYVQDIYLGGDPYLLQKPDDTFSNNIFISYEQGDLKYTSVRQNTPPFSEIANFKLNIGENIYNRMYILEQDKLLLAKYNSFLPDEYCLCQYTYPDTLTSLDELTSDNIIKPTGNILWGKDNYETEVDFYSWQNDSIEFIGDYNFGINVSDNIMLPNRNKLYVVGRYQLDEFDFTLTANQPNDVPNCELTLQNHPNPFNPSTTISFMLPEPATQVKVNIYNLKGQKIRTLSRNSLQQGEHNLVWNGKDDKDNSVASGVYLYRLQVDGQTKATSKCLLLK
jgi:hypothetical protein